MSEETLVILLFYFFIGAFFGNAANNVGMSVRQSLFLWVFWPVGVYILWRDRP